MQTTSWCSQWLPLQRMWSLRRTRSWGSASTKRQKNKEHAYDPPEYPNITLGRLKSLKSPNWTWFTPFTPFTPFTRHLQHFHLFPSEIWTLTWLWQSVDEGRGRCCLRWPRHGHGTENFEQVLHLSKALSTTEVGKANHVVSPSALCVWLYLYHWSCWIYIYLYIYIFKRSQRISTLSTVSTGSISVHWGWNTAHSVEGGHVSTSVPQNLFCLLRPLNSVFIWKSKSPTLLCFVSLDCLGMFLSVVSQVTDRSWWWMSWKPMSLERTYRKSRLLHLNEMLNEIMKCCHMMQHVHIEQPWRIWDPLVVVLWREYGAGANFSIEIPKCKIQEHHKIKVSRSRLELCVAGGSVHILPGFQGLVSSSSFRIRSNRNTPVCWIPQGSPAAENWENTITQQTSDSSEWNTCNNWK